MLPDTGTREVYDPRLGRVVTVAPGQMVSGEVALTLCDPCLAAVALGGEHPHRLSVAITGGTR